MRQNEENTKQGQLPDPLIENVHYYYENGFMVLTEVYLKARGYCCGNGCRHCPYTGDDKKYKSSCKN